MAPNKRDTVQVAIRIRPLSDREKDEKARVCTRVIPGLPQVAIGEDKSFTYDHVFDQHTLQHVVYDMCIRDLVKGTFEGFNATVLAYGQTGSGKTFTMGTGLDPLTNPFEDDRTMGIVPRAARQLFSTIQELKQAAREAGQDEPVFEISVQFVELYNEDIIDLLAGDRSKQITIHEHPERKEIYLKGVASLPVLSDAMIMEALRAGAIKRTTAATNMNQHSSRSHAIFTIMVKQQRIVPIKNFEAEPDPNTTLNGVATELEVVYAKFHFVDLAGSERLKRTGATGDRAKEGISINSGLLALGNVINALGKAMVLHVPYRDSKLTRLLQDSLGGNSRTLMIACASPSDADAAETLNTLQYANRAKNIQNKAVANQLKPSHRISQLEAEKATYIDKMRSLESENARERKEKERLEAQNNDFRKQIESLTQEKADLLAEKDKAVNDFESRVHELEKDKNDALADVQNLTARFNDANNARQLRERENDDMKREAESLKAQMDLLRHQLQEEVTQRTELENRPQTCIGNQQSLQRDDQIAQSNKDLASASASFSPEPFDPEPPRSSPIAAGVKRKRLDPTDTGADVECVECTNKVRRIADLEEDLRIERELADLRRWDDARLNLNEKLLANIVEKAKFTRPTLIQGRLIPYIMGGNDTKFKADSDDELTAGYLIPIIQKIAAMSDQLQYEHFENPAPIAVVIRTNKDKGCLDAYKLGKELVQGLNVTVGRANSLNSVRNSDGEVNVSCDILFVTIDALLRFVRNDTITLDRLKFLVVDEAADKSNWNFRPNLAEKMRQLLQLEGFPKKDQRQTMLFFDFPSDEVRDLGEEILREDNQLAHDWRL